MLSLSNGLKKGTPLEQNGATRVMKKGLRYHMMSPMNAAWSTGLVLENLKLKVAALEYLQLPIAIHEGNLGRLEIQVRATMI